jgi:sortase A
MTKTVEGDHALSVYSMGLCRGFIEELLDESVTHVEDGTPITSAQIDWDDLWAEAREAQSLEQAIGRVLVRVDALPRAHTQTRSQPDKGTPSDTSGAEPATVLALRRSKEVSRAPIRAQAGVLTNGASTTYVSTSPVETVTRFDSTVGSTGTVEFVPVARPPTVPAQIGAEAAIQQAEEDSPLPVVTIPRGARRQIRRQRLASFFGWVQFTGLVMCLFVAWQLWGTSISEHHAQASLREQFVTHARTPPAKAGGAPYSLVPADTRLPAPNEGAVEARIQIPSIGVDQYVVEGTAEQDLAKGPGHYVGTALPGQAGNVAIAGHRTTYGAPFNRLDALGPGDTIVLTPESGEVLDYVVTAKPVAVAPTDVAVLDSYGDNRLTLTTCNPKFSASQRLVAVAYLKTPVAVPSVVSRQAPPTRLILDKAAAEAAVGWHFVYLPAALLILALLAVLGMANYKSEMYLGKRLKWLVLAPLWVAGVYLLFETLTSLLPATI